MRHRTFFTQSLSLVVVKTLPLYIFCYQALEDGIARHQSTVNAMNTAGHEIIGKSTTVEADMLRDKLATQNRRWQSICNQVTDRRDRYLL